MQFSRYIFSISFVLIFGLLHVQPFLPKAKLQMEMVCAKKPVKKPSCSKSMCSKEEPADKEDEKNEENECEQQGCNPFVPCSIGFCCYLVENFYTSTDIPSLNKEKLPLSNDNRLTNISFGCWHPPEMRS